MRASKKWVISDLHLCSKTLVHLQSGQRFGTTSEEHDAWIKDQWNSVVKKQDLVYVLGDVSMTLEGLDQLKYFKGSKILVRGNHDVYHASKYLEYFQEVHGLIHYRNVFWMSHCPLHPQELRGRFNLHGHVHGNSIPDARYINCCVETNGGVPQSLDDLFIKYEALKKGPVGPGCNSAQLTGE